jgi:hypothetical protein
VGSKLLYDLHEPAIRALYTEVKERALATGELLPGTPGTLVKRAGTGHEYWYRSFYPIPKKRSEQFVGPVSNALAYESMQGRIANSDWTTKQVAALSKLGYQVSDKVVASVLLEIHNRKLFAAGLTLVGTLAYMAWLNEYGAIATATKIQGIHLARVQPLKLAANVALLAVLQSTQLPFAPVAGASHRKPSTAATLPGVEGIRVDVLGSGAVLGEIVPVPEIEWRARAVPFFGYLLEGSRSIAMLAGGHCIPVRVPQVTRMIWHKLFSSTRRKKDPAKAEQDLLQAATLAAVLIEQEKLLLRESFREAPGELRNAALSQLLRLENLLAEHPRARDEFRKLR